MNYNFFKALQCSGGRLVLANALVWGALIIALAYVLRGTPDAGIVVVLASGAAAASLSIVSAQRSRNVRTN